jgi:hypothetical protein
MEQSQELYEPLWDEMHSRLRASGIKIRGIWIADVAQQGQSSVINENILGNDRKFIITYIILIQRLMLYSIMVRPSSGSVSDDQPLPRSNATTTDRHGA